MVYLREHNWDLTIQKATDCLDIEMTSKALFRRGKAFAQKGDFQSALNDLSEGKNLFPQDLEEYEAEIGFTKSLANNANN
jgi:regulator of sirC expression with transglutaminase-like and TPR domain